MRILIGCEFSGRVREAFAKKGHEVLSCDYLPTDIPGNHYQGNILDVLYDGWDMLIAFPPCTFLCSSGLHWNLKRPERSKKTEEALAFVELLLNAPINKIALENPVGCISSRIRKPDQIIQPWMFGEDASKKTCLWLKNLDKLEPTCIIKKDIYANQTPSKQNKLGPSKDRAKLRSLTYNGVAESMANTWG
jgi:hypothetical protein